MADEKSKLVTDAPGPGPAQTEAGGNTPPLKQEQAAPEVISPEVEVPEPVIPAPQDETPDKVEQIVHVNLSELHVFPSYPYQERIDEEIGTLVSSIKDEGVLRPIVVRPREDGGYEIVSGHRRWRASQLAGLKDIPCIVRDLTDEQAVKQMREANRSPLQLEDNPPEEPKSVPGPDKAVPEAAAPGPVLPAPQDKAADVPREPEAASVSVYNFSEIMAEKKAADKAAVKDAGKSPDKMAPAPADKDVGPKKEQQAQPPKRKGRPPRADKEQAAAPAQKEAPGKKEKEAPKPDKSKQAEKAVPDDKAKKIPNADKPEKEKPQEAAPVPEKTPAAPAGAPRPAKDEQIVYIKLSELHTFKNHPFQVRNDEEMRAMVSSVKDKGVTQPAIVRPREGGGYEIVSGHRRHKASELAGFGDMPCIVRDLTDEQAITQMVEDNTNQRENILPSERAKALKMQLEAIKHQGARDTSGQIDPKDAGRRSNEIVAERNKMTVKQVQRYIKLNDLVPDLQKMMDEGRLKFTPAVELAYIKPKNQRYIAVAIESQQSSPSLSQAQRMRELDQKGVLNGDVIDGIMMEDKKEVDKVILTGAELSKYFGKEATPREMKDTIIRLLDDWKGQQKEKGKQEKKAPEAEK